MSALWEPPSPPPNHTVVSPVRLRTPKHLRTTRVNYLAQLEQESLSASAAASKHSYRRMRGVASPDAFGSSQVMLAAHGFEVASPRVNLTALVSEPVSIPIEHLCVPSRNSPDKKGKYKKRADKERLKDIHVYSGSRLSLKSIQVVGGERFDVLGRRNSAVVDLAGCLKHVAGAVRAGAPLDGLSERDMLLFELLQIRAECELPPRPSVWDACESVWYTLSHTLLRGDVGYADFRHTPSLARVASVILSSISHTVCPPLNKLNSDSPEFVVSGSAGTRVFVVFDRAACENDALNNSGDSTASVSHVAEDVCWNVAVSACLMWSRVVPVFLDFGGLHARRSANGTEFTLPSTVLAAVLAHLHADSAAVSSGKDSLPVLLDYAQSKHGLVFVVVVSGVEHVYDAWASASGVWESEGETELQRVRRVENASKSLSVLMQLTLLCESECSVVCFTCSDGVTVSGMLKREGVSGARGLPALSPLVLGVKVE